MTIASGITGGSVSATPSSGPAGTSVILSNTPASGYVLWYYTVDGVQITGSSFTLNHNVTVSAVFEPITYNVTIPSGITGGSVSATPSSGPAGTSVTLSNTPASGYVFDYYIVDGGQITGSSFTLNHNVTVSAVFNPGPNLTTPIGNPSVRLYLNDSTSPLVEGGRTNAGSAGSGTYTVSIANGSYSQIIWYLNGKVLPGAAGTSIALSKQTSGVYLITVEAALTGGDRNTGSHTFVIE